MTCSIRSDVAGYRDAGDNDPVAGLTRLALRAQRSKRLTRSTLGTVFVISGLLGCHASPDDPAGQAKELFDSVRRPNAIRNIERLYTVALAGANGDRSNPDVVAVVDATVDQLAKAYLEFPEDIPSGGKILKLLNEMRDPRGLPAALKALNWRPVTQDHATAAAKLVRLVDVPTGEHDAVAKALGDAAKKVRQSRPADVRLRREVILALGSLGAAPALPPLIEIMERQSEDQDFLFNLLAASEVAKLVSGDEYVPVLLRALFRFDAAHPERDLKDVARSGLVRIGGPAVAPLLQVFRGDNQEVRAMAGAYLAALKARGVTGYTEESLMQIRAAETLGEIGAKEAFEAIDAAARSDRSDLLVRWEAACALVKFDVEEGQRAAVREALVAVYNASDTKKKPRLLGAMRRSFDPGFLQFLLTQAKDKEVHPNLRILAFASYAQLANKSEAEALAAVIEAEPAVEDGGYRHKFDEYAPLLALAAECDEDLACWVRQVSEGSDSNALVKAATMLGRVGQANESAVAALVAKLDFPKIDVRVAALQALDRIAVGGSAEAVSLLDVLAEREEGTQIGKQFATVALPIRARLASRGG